MLCVQVSVCAHAQASAISFLGDISPDKWIQTPELNIKTIVKDKTPKN